MPSQVAARALIVVTLLVLAPAAAFAQASITGVVRDASGAVLPGVTVEAASPALIEKIRTVVTGIDGQYRIVDLRPGAYTVTFTLTGFSTVRREGLELSGSLTATIDADMRVGGVEETITVTGETPLVDVVIAPAADVRESSKRSLIEAGARKEVVMMVPVNVRLALFAGVATPIRRDFCRDA